MSEDSFFALIKSALPEDMHPDELLGCVPPEMWRKMPYEAAVIALRNCPRLNWDAYLERNPDVRASGMEPYLHYVAHGVYEGRRLISWHTLKKVEEPGRPLVSIVIINYNNRHFLRKSLGSVTCQTLKDLEIIVVDDCSTDGSLKIINEYAAQDERIKVLVNEQNSGTLFSRKRGTLGATGRYLMFLDSDDYLEPDACEIATTAIAHGYDIVKFGVHLTNVANLGTQEIENCAMWCNKGYEREYFYDEIVSSIFTDSEMSWLLWASIYLRELVVEAFNDLPDAYFTGADDALIVLAISHRARSLLKIPNKLIHYSFGLGISVTSEHRAFFKYLPARCDTARYFKGYVSRHGLNINVEKLYLDLCEPIISKFIYIAKNDEVASGMSFLASSLGKDCVLKFLIDRYINNPQKMAGFVRSLDNIPTKVRHIGIICPELLQPWGLTIIRSLCDFCAEDKYRITVFTEQKYPEYKLTLQESVKVIRMNSIYYDNTNLIEHIQDLVEDVEECGLDAMLYVGRWQPCLLLYVLVLHWINVPIVFIDYYNRSLMSKHGYGLESQARMAIARSADAVICASLSEELYLRQNGVNAISIPYPVNQINQIHRRGIPAIIAVICGKGTTIDQVRHVLLVLQEAVKHAPWVSMFIICDYEDAEKTQEYSSQVKELYLQKHVRFKKLTEDISRLLESCGIFLSTTHDEFAFVGVAEAQALGLPCVVYDSVIPCAGDNPSIIRIPEGDCLGAAREIINLFMNPDKWLELSAMATENSKKFTPEIFIENMRHFFNNFPLSMPLHSYQASDYVDLAKMVSLQIIA